MDPLRTSREWRHSFDCSGTTQLLMEQKHLYKPHAQLNHGYEKTLNNRAEVLSVLKATSRSNTRAYGQTHSNALCPSDLCILTSRSSLSLTDPQLNSVLHMDRSRRMETVLMRIVTVKHYCLRMKSPSAGDMAQCEDLSD